jgi:16S rRNA G966 N2-methylase RsmD
MRQVNANIEVEDENKILNRIEGVFTSLKKNGFSSTIKKINEHLSYKAKGVDFKSQNISDLTKTGEFKEEGTALISTSKDFLTKIFNDLEQTIGKPIKKTVFIDYGSGKGSAIIHAKNIGFEKTIGIEFAKELHDIAVANIEKFNIKNVESFYADATSFPPPSDVSIIYFNNPFTEVVMEKVVQNILNEKKNFTNDVYIIYGSASTDMLKDKFEFLKEVIYANGARADFYKV